MTVAISGQDDHGPAEGDGLGQFHRRCHGDEQGCEFGAEPPQGPGGTVMDLSISWSIAYGLFRWLRL